MSSLKYLLAFAIMATLASSAFAVYCYQCGSLLTPKCGEPFEPEESMKVDCSRTAVPLYVMTLLTGRNAASTGCMKQTVESRLTGNHIQRSCYFGDIKDTDAQCKLDPTDILSKQLSCDVCSDNLCNGSRSMAPIVVVIVSFLGLARIFS